MADQTDFRKLTSPTERAKLFSEIDKNLTGGIVGGLTEDQHQFQFTLNGVEKAEMHLEAIAPVSRALKAGDAIRLSFCLGDGQYFLDTKVESASMNDIVVPYGDSNEFVCLQRRSSVRVPVNSDSGMKYSISSVGTKMLPAPLEMIIVDVSSGGLRIVWPTREFGNPTIGDRLSGNLVISSQRKVELFASVKTVFPQQFGNQVGLEFLNLSMRDEQALLFLCMKLRFMTPAP